MRLRGQAVQKRGAVGIVTGSSLNRRVEQCLSYWHAEEILREMWLSQFMSYDMLWEMLNFADGRHNLLQIRNAACAQFREIGIKPIKDVFEELKKRGMSPEFPEFSDFEFRWSIALFSILGNYLLSSSFMMAMTSVFSGSNFRNFL
jgi:hypothetical protein